MSGRVRNIEEWAAQTIAYLSRFEPRRRRIETYDYDEQLQHLVAHLGSVSVRRLHDVLKSLYFFARFWGIPLEDVMPREEEISEWFREQ